MKFWPRYKNISVERISSGKVRIKAISTFFFDSFPRPVSFIGRGTVWYRETNQGLRRCGTLTDGDLSDIRETWEHSPDFYTIPD